MSAVKVQVWAQNVRIRQRIQCRGIPAELLPSAVTTAGASGFVPAAPCMADLYNAIRIPPAEQQFGARVEHMTIGTPQLLSSAIVERFPYIPKARHHPFRSSQ
jgi:hypothetical protein